MPSENPAYFFRAKISVWYYLAYHLSENFAPEFFTYYMLCILGISMQIFLIYLNKSLVITEIGWYILFVHIYRRLCNIIENIFTLNYNTSVLFYFEITTNFLQNWILPQISLRSCCLLNLNVHKECIFLCTDICYIDCSIPNSCWYVGT